MLEKIAKMAECLQQCDFDNAKEIEAAIIIIAKNQKMTIVGGGSLLLQARAIARLIKQNPLLQLGVLAMLKDDE